MFASADWTSLFDKGSFLVRYDFMEVLGPLSHAKP